FKPCLAGAARRNGLRLVPYGPKAPASMGRFLLSYDCVAVRLGDVWRLYDPGEAELPSGMIPWKLEGQMGMICRVDSSCALRFPIASPEASAESRRADLRLGEDGTLKGTLRWSWSGHFLERLGSDSPAKNRADAEAL